MALDLVVGDVLTVSKPFAVGLAAYEEALDAPADLEVGGGVVGTQQITKKYSQVGTKIVLTTEIKTLV